MYAEAGTLFAKERKSYDELTKAVDRTGDTHDRGRDQSGAWCSDWILELR